MPANKPSPAPAGNTSSDFVRKLYRMLEEPEYSDIVRWGKTNDSFVVLEGEKFSTCVLPKHFKHGNFASFVRQLNKYDFHKVRRPDDGSPGYGPNAWEFKHPDFRADAKDRLDTIRRKAPASKKTQQQQQQQQQPQQPPRQQQQENATEPPASARQVQSLTKSLYDLQNKVAELSEINKQLASEIVSLQKSAGVQRQASYEMLHYLESSARRAAQNAVQSPAGAMGRGGDDGGPAELRRTKELLASLGPPNPTTDTCMERSHTIYPSPAESSTSSAMFVAPDMNAGIAVMNDPVSMSRLGVYPAVQPAAMGAFHSDHMQTIPYPVAQNGGMEGVAAGVRDAARVTASPPTEKSDDWGPKKPHIFLVEDDKICAKIGMKFLKSLGCTVALAKDGLAAVQTFEDKPATPFDLIFMDIFMPRQDGVSATSRIRDWFPALPIVAMTSNIRQEDVATYFEYGMTDVLAKPFTREGMQRMLRKHLSHLLGQPSPPATSVEVPYADAQANGAIHAVRSDMPTADQASMAAGHMAIKYENTPIQSPSGGQAGAGAWHSPSPITNHSPTASPLTIGGCVGVSSGGQLVMTSAVAAGGGFTGFMTPAMGPPGQGRDVERPEKRQRISGPAGMMR